MDGEADSLVRNLFLVGSYAACIRTASTSKLSTDSLVYVARAHLAMDTPDLQSARKVLSSLTTPTPAAVAANLLAELIESSDAAPSVAERALPLVQEEEATGSKSGPVRPIVATILHLAGQDDDALKVTAAGIEDLEQECVALQIAILLAMSRADLAEETYEQAKSWAEDSVSIQLCEAWLALVEGGRRYQTAYYAFDEMSALPGSLNPNLLNGKAIAKASMGDYEDAQSSLTQAQQLDAKNSSTMANTAVTSYLCRRSKADGQFSQLSQTFPNHPLVQDITKMESLFDEAAQSFATAA